MRRKVDSRKRPQLDGHPAIEPHKNRKHARTPDSSSQRASGPLVKRRKTTADAVVTLNSPATQPLDVYVFGSNSFAELGLGADVTSGSVKRPRLNTCLLANTVGVVEIANGGMHSVAITQHNTILTWGVNDRGALGRDTTWEGWLKDAKMADEESSDDSENGEQLNPKESTPTALSPDLFPPGTTFAHVVATDNASFALTADGLVYGWGTFVASDGAHAYSATVKQQHRPALIPNLSRITKLAAGSNHVLALTNTGTVLTWGFGEQCQLGRRVVSRNLLSGLVPRPMGLKNIVNIGSGADHAFAINNNGDVYGWGSNNYAQTGIADNVGDDSVPIDHPTLVKSLQSVKIITSITGGNHHSIAVTKDGRCLAWGRAEDNALGLQLKALPGEHVIKGALDRVRVVKVPSHIPSLEVRHVAAGSAHTLAITTDGEAYSWGPSQDYQTGHGTDDDVEIPRLVQNTAVKGKILTWAGAGGQYSMLVGVSAAVHVNGA